MGELISVPKDDRLDLEGKLCVGKEFGDLWGVMESLDLEKKPRAIEMGDDGERGAGESR